MEVIRFPDVPFLSSLDRLFSLLVFVFSLDTVVIAAISLDLSVLHFGQTAVPWSIVSFLWCVCKKHLGLTSCLFECFTVTGVVIKLPWKEHMVIKRGCIIVGAGRSSNVGHSSYA